MTARKTIPVEDVKKLANKMLADSIPEYTRERLAVCSLIEHVLMDTGNYRGFGYLPGVVDFTTDPPTFPGDETRRQYY